VHVSSRPRAQSSYSTNNIRVLQGSAGTWWTCSKATATQAVSNNSKLQSEISEKKNSRFRQSNKSVLLFTNNDPSRIKRRNLTNFGQLTKTFSASIRLVTIKNACVWQSSSSIHQKRVEHISSWLDKCFICAHLMSAWWVRELSEVSDMTIIHLAGSTSLASDRKSAHQTSWTSARWAFVEH